MEQTAFEQRCSCPCGTTTFTLHRAPVMRFICHCTVCQAFNGTPFADMVVAHTRGVALPADHQVDFKAYRPPPAVQRGKCKACDRPAIEFMRLPIYPALTFIPTGNFVNATALPEPCMHVFYEKRVADAEDDLPRYEGYLHSQLAFARKFYAGVLSRGKAPH